MTLTKDERFTPPDFLMDMHRLYRFTIDAASSPLAPSTAIIGRCWTKEQNGLAQSWAGHRVWCNPPFSEIYPWVKKAWMEPDALIVMLVPSWTDRIWWQQLVEPYRDRPGSRLTTRFYPRMSFGTPDEPVRQKSQPNLWPVLLVFAPLSPV